MKKGIIMKKLLSFIAIICLMAAACVKDNESVPENNDTTNKSDTTTDTIASPTQPTEDTTTTGILDSLMRYMFGGYAYRHESSNGHFNGDIYAIRDTHFIVNSLNELQQQTGFAADPHINFDDSTLVFGVIRTPTTPPHVDSVTLTYIPQEDYHLCSIYVWSGYYQAEDAVCYWHIFPKVTGDLRFMVYRQ